MVPTTIPDRKCRKSESRQPICKITHKAKTKRKQNFIASP
jgi:hypothetical protein